MSIEISGLYLEHLFLLFVRILAILFSAPIFSQRSVPVLARIGLAGLLAYLLLLPSPGPLASLPSSLGYFLLLTGREIMLGLLIGFVVMLAIVGLEMAGTLIGSRIGLNMAQLFNPLTSEPVAVMDQFFAVLAGLLFLSLRGHHWLILGIAESLRLAPLGTFQLDVGALADLIPLSATIFRSALRIALPVFAAVTLTDVALALIARAAPQMHIFLIGLPLKALIALAVLVFTLPFMGIAMAQILREGMAQVVALLGATG